MQGTVHLMQLSVEFGGCESTIYPENLEGYVGSHQDIPYSENLLINEKLREIKFAHVLVLLQLLG